MKHQVNNTIETDKDYKSALDAQAILKEMIEEEKSSNNYSINDMKEQLTWITKKIEKYEQKKAELSTFNRMDGLAKQSEIASAISSLQFVVNDLLDEGFEREEVKNYLDYFVNKLVGLNNNN